MKWSWKTRLFPLNPLFGNNSGSTSATTATERVLDKTRTVFQGCNRGCSHKFYFNVLLSKNEDLCTVTMENIDSDRMCWKSCP